MTRATTIWWSPGFGAGLDVEAQEGADSAEFVELDGRVGPVLLAGSGCVGSGGVDDLDLGTGRDGEADQLLIEVNRGEALEVSTGRMLGGHRSGAEDVHLEIAPTRTGQVVGDDQGADAALLEGAEHAVYAGNGAIVRTNPVGQVLNGSDLLSSFCFNNNWFSGGKRCRLRMRSCRAGRSPERGQQGSDASRA